MTNIIFISFEFPPLSAGGVFRSKEFARNLPAENILPYVYCLSPDHYKNIYPDFKLDEGLLEDMVESGLKSVPVPIDPVWELYRNPVRKFFNIYFNIYRGNEHRKWRSHLITKVMEDARSVDFKAVLVTAPPFGMLPLAAEIAEKLKLPLIIDMRDAWSMWNSTGFGSYFHYLATLKKESQYFNKAAAVIATSAQTITDWQQLHPSIAQNKFTCITNGFKRETVTEIKRKIIVDPVSDNKKFDIVYVGSFYFSPETRENMLTPAWKRKRLRKLQYYPRRQDWLYRSPHFFLKAVARVLEMDPSLQNKIRIRFAGNTQPWLIEMVGQFGLQKEVEFLGFLNHKEALDLQRNADALLITSAKVYNGRDCFIAGKTFEYIVMNKPIFAFVAEGSQKDILKGTGLSIEFDPDDVEASALKMKEIFQKGIQLSPDQEYIETFDRQKLTKKLAQVINAVVEKETR